MVTKKMDPRVIKTRNNLRRALVSLMQRESLSSISVQKITETAHITRGTFYLHYKDKQDFIQTALQDFIDDLFANVMITPPDWRASRVFSLKCAFAYIEQNADVFTVLLGKSVGERFYDQLFERLQGEMMAYVRETRLQVDHSAVPLELQIDFVVSAVLGVISRWLDQGLVYTSRYMTLNVAKMLNGAEGLTPPVTTFFDAQLQVELGIQPV